MSKWSLSGSRAGMESDDPSGEVEERPPLKVIVLGDFSGRGTHRNAKQRGSGAIRPFLIDRDNLEQILQHFNVRLDDVPGVDRPVRLVRAGPVVVRRRRLPGWAHDERHRVRGRDRP